MSKKYKLLKDLPNVKAGAIGEEQENGRIKFYYAGGAPTPFYAFSEDNIKQNPDWFEEIKEKPPLGVTPEYIWKEQRLDDIRQAMNRFNDYHNHSKHCLQEWLDEKHELEKWVHKSKYFQHKPIEPHPTVVVPDSGEFITAERAKEMRRDAFNAARKLIWGGTVSGYMGEGLVYKTFEHYEIMSPPDQSKPSGPIQ